MRLHFFASKSTISRFGERFRDSQYSLVSLLFAVLLLTVPPACAQPYVKVGARATVPYGVGTTGSNSKLSSRGGGLLIFVPPPVRYLF